MFIPDWNALNYLSKNSPFHNPGFIIIKFESKFRLCCPERYINVMKIPQSIPLSIYILLQMIISSFLGFFFTRNSFWPGIDAVAPVQNMNSFSAQMSSDLFVTSSSEISGRTPYNMILKIVDIILPFGTEFALSALSSITMMLSTSLIFLALITSIRKRSETTKYIIPSGFLIAYLLYLLGILITLKLPYGSSIYMAGYGPTVSPWSTPEFLSMALNGSGIVLLNTTSWRGRKITKISVFFLLFLATLIHPASSFFFLMIIILSGICFKTIYRNDIYLIGSALLTAFIILAFLIGRQTNTLNSAEFVEIYAKLRHPHHFVPSYYLNQYNVLTYLLAFLFSLTLCRKSLDHRNITIGLFVFFLISNFGQFFFVEIFPVRFIAAFGPSRINSYVLISYFVIIVHYLLLNFGPPESVNKAQFKSPFVINYKIYACLILLFFCFSTNFVYQDYRDFRNHILKEVQALKLDSGDLVLFDSNIATQGFREFSEINIWLDSYFMFNFKGIEIYRERWLQSCGPKPIESCQDLFINGDSQNLYNFVRRSGVQKIVTSTPLDNLLIQENFSLLGYSGGKWSYGLKDIY